MINTWYYSVLIVIFGTPPLSPSNSYRIQQKNFDSLRGKEFERGAEPLSLINSPFLDNVDGYSRKGDSGEMYINDHMSVERYASLPKQIK